MPRISADRAAAAQLLHIANGGGGAFASGSPRDKLRRSFRCSALHHTNLLRRLLRHVCDERSLPPKNSLLCAALRCSALLCAAPHKPIKKTSAPCKISSKHKQQSKLSFYKRDKCAMHGRSMKGSRRLIHEATEALRLPPKLSCRTRRSQDRRAQTRAIMER